MLKLCWSEPRGNLPSPFQHQYGFQHLATVWKGSLRTQSVRDNCSLTVSSVRTCPRSF